MGSTHFSSDVVSGANSSVYFGNVEPYLPSSLPHCNFSTAACVVVNYGSQSSICIEFPYSSRAIITLSEALNDLSPQFEGEIAFNCFSFSLVSLHKTNAPPFFNYSENFEMSNVEVP